MPISHHTYLPTAAIFEDNSNYQQQVTSTGNFYSSLQRNVDWQPYEEYLATSTANSPSPKPPTNTSGKKRRGWKVSNINLIKVN